MKQVTISEEWSHKFEDQNVVLEGLKGRKGRASCHYSIITKVKI